MSRQGSPPSTEELRAWLRLSHTAGLGPVRGRLLLQHFGPPEAILQAGVGPVADALQSQARAEAFFGSDPWREAVIVNALRWLRRGPQGPDAWHGPDVPRGILLLTDPGYPRRLLDLADPPLLLYCIGKVPCLGHPQVAIVGSRNATALGACTAHAFARALTAAGWTVISGMAEGIDQAAHEGALAAAGGNTVAALGTGMDRIYPSRHRHLARRIAARGALISEQPLGMPPMRANFPRRNRLIAAMASGILVVEAAPRSGSLITARLAAELGREVLAVPGSIHSPLARGCNALIRQGAKLVESAADILTELPSICQLGLRSAFPDASMTRSPTAGTPSQAPWQATPEPAGGPQGGGPQSAGPQGVGPPGRREVPEEGEVPEAGEVPREQARMLAAMSADPVTLEILAARQNLPIAGALAALQTLELRGFVQRQLDGSYVRCRRLASPEPAVRLLPEPAP